MRRACALAVIAVVLLGGLLVASLTSGISPAAAITVVSGMVAVITILIRPATARPRSVHTSWSPRHPAGEAQETYPETQD
jgi:hypothetical protein